MGLGRVTCYPSSLGRGEGEANSEYRTGGLSRSPGPSTDGTKRRDPELIGAMPVAVPRSGVDREPCRLSSLNKIPPNEGSSCVVVEPSNPFHTPKRRGEGEPRKKEEEAILVTK
jgi:hypothetical protein